MIVGLLSTMPVSYSFIFTYVPLKIKIELIETCVQTTTMAEPCVEGKNQFTCYDAYVGVYYCCDRNRYQRCCPQQNNEGCC